MPRDILHASLWDLRSQYEDELRILTAAQKCVDEWRTSSAAAARAKALREVRRHLAKLIDSHRTVGSLLQDAIAVAEGAEATTAPKE